MHFDGSFVSIYFAVFPSAYLHAVRDGGLNTVISQPSLKLYRSQIYDLFETDQRTSFIRQFVALVRMIADGRGNVGHLRRDKDVVHRNDKSEPVVIPSWMNLDIREMKEWDENKWES